MSGSSWAERKLSRCVVSLDSGIRRSFALRPDGSSPEAEYHARHEAEFRRRLDAATPAIEVLFDELEQRGRRFLSPGEQAFTERHQAASTGAVEQLTLEVACEPKFVKAELQTLVERIAKLVSAD